MRNPTLAEQETVIRWDREDPLVHVWSANPAVWRKFERLGIKPSRVAPGGKFYTLSTSEFRWGKKRSGYRGSGPPPRRAKTLALHGAPESSRGDESVGEGVIGAPQADRAATPDPSHK